MYINNIFQIQNLNCADNEYNYTSKNEEVEILYESSVDFCQTGVYEESHDDSNYNNNDINNVEIMGNYLEFINEDKNKEKLEDSKFSSNIEFNQNNKNDSNSKFTFGIKLSSIPCKTKNNEVNDNNNCSEKEIINEIGGSNKNNQKAIIINLKFVSNEEFNKDKSNDKKQKKRIKRGRVMSRIKDKMYNSKVIRFNINNIKLDYKKIISKKISTYKNIETKILPIISFISNIIYFNSKYIFTDIFRKIINNDIKINYNNSRINILFSLEENENVYITLLTNNLIIFYNDRGKMIEIIYPYGFIISKLLYKINKYSLGYLLSF